MHWKLRVLGNTSLARNFTDLELIYNIYIILNFMYVCLSVCGHVQVYKETRDIGSLRARVTGNF